jgi:2-phosphosulfolactate phosphatase
MPHTLKLEWGIDGLKRAIARDDDIVIIDVLRFSSAVVTAAALGFVIRPAATEDRQKETETLSPVYFFGKKPSKVTIFSSNGAFLALSAAKKSKNVVIGALLNAESIAKYIDGNKRSVTLLAAGEINKARLTLLDEYEKNLANGNMIFSLEDMLGAGAISHFSHLKKSRECIKAEKIFRATREILNQILLESASGKYDQIHDRVEDIFLSSRLNCYRIIPKLHATKSSPEIRPISRK